VFLQKPKAEYGILLYGIVVIKHYIQDGRIKILLSHAKLQVQVGYRILAVCFVEKESDPIIEMEFQALFAMKVAI
jgi:cobalamin-dependent methionine synthase I